MQIEDGGGGVTNPLASLQVYASEFERLAIIAVVFGIFVLAIAPLLKKRMHGIH
jgi:dipeptide/tripeptide permease